MPDGLTDFKRLLAEFKGLSAWAVGGGVAVPFAASLASFSPPWPEGIVPVTALCELLALIFVFQFLRASARPTIGKVMIIGALAFAVAGLGYLYEFSSYTYETPITHVRLVKGFTCTADAQAVFKEQCPNLGMDALNTAEYEAERLWTPKSITLARMTIAGTWLLAFLMLATVIGSFLVSQLNTSAKTAEA